MENKPQRMTKQRKIILEELRKLTSHPTADELYEIVRERLPRISLGTVYRNLDVLSENGEVLKLESAGSQKRFDGDVSSHCHVRCVNCGRVGDVMDELPEPEVHSVSAPGFTITHGATEFYGVCDTCRDGDELAAPGAHRTQ
ncbi:Fur family transcriptional regulator [Desulfovibrio ferrophilus]|uniref:Fur family ferric uptake regulator n=1 Tax=Desulfovibrio ferrophilus TaxID=241368 RepID=A0A2Z6B0S2_9BACT|nr:transcriptional repressor [Desulfovibrio ferrophilus]BBD09055.1 Fur family ferric uptake regulator [Desulfovibrio ferrophilus]